MNFQILLTSKIKCQEIRKLFEIIDAIQSYDYDWKFYLVNADTSNELRISEKLTPIPTNLGAFDILEYRIDEEGFVEASKNYLKSKERKLLREVLKVGYPIDKVLREDLIERIVIENPEIIKEVNIELFFVIKKDIEFNDFEAKAKSFLKSIDFLKNKSYEIIRTGYYYLPPNLVMKALEKSYYLIDYISNLIETYERTNYHDEGYILIIRGSCKASLTLVEIESIINSHIGLLKDFVLQRTLLFNRIL